MLSRARIVRTALTTLVALSVMQVPARADGDGFLGNAECDSSGNGPGCDVEAGDDSQKPPKAQEGEDPATPKGGGRKQPQEPQLVPGCLRVGAEQQCQTTVESGGGDAGEDAPEVDPAEVANAARDSLTLPDPAIVTSPASDQPVLVQVPVWLWLERDSWLPKSAKAQVPGGDVSVTATPSQARWSMGDGSTVECDGRGTAFDPAKYAADEASPSCGHTYTRASAGQQSGAFALEVDVQWDITWESSEGEGGELEPLVTSAAADVEVVESQGLVESVR